MPIRFRCTQCKQALSIATRRAGARIKCPKCQEELTVPAAPAEETRETIVPSSKETIAPHSPEALWAQIAEGATNSTKEETPAAPLPEPVSPPATKEAVPEPAAKEPEPAPEPVPPSTKRFRLSRKQAILSGSGAAFLLLATVGGICLLDSGQPAPANDGEADNSVAVAPEPTIPAPPSQPAPPPPPKLAEEPVALPELVAAPSPVEDEPMARVMKPEPAKPEPAVNVPALPEEPRKQGMPEPIRKAVAAGVEYLKKTQNEDGSWDQVGQAMRGAGAKNLKVAMNPTALGTTALAGWALLEGFVPASDPAVQKAAKYIRLNSSNLTFTHSLGAVVLFLDRLGDPKDKPLIRTLASRLLTGQNNDGGWGYNSPKGAAEFTENSTSEFAVMGLWRSRHHGVRANGAIVGFARHVRKFQHADGGHPYSTGQGIFGFGGQNAYSTICLTAGGLLGEAYGWAASNPKRGTRELEKFQSVRKAMGFIEKKMKGDFAESHPYMSLWALGRVGVVYDREKIGGLDWYKWGADKLLPEQGKNGGWGQGLRGGAALGIRLNVGGAEDAGSPLNTAFAILFLARANPAPDLTQMVRSESIGERENAAARKLEEAKKVAEADPKKAAPLLQKLIADFPRTEAAVEAKNLLEQGRPKPTTVDKEKAAAAKLKLAEYSRKDKAKYLKKLKEIVAEYPGTPSAERAKALMEESAAASEK